MREAASANWATGGGKVAVAAAEKPRAGPVDSELRPPTPAIPSPHPSLPLSLSPSAEKFWFCRLSLNHKVLHYGDLDESPQGEVPFELLSDKSKTC